MSATPPRPLDPHTLKPLDHKKGLRVHRDFGQDQDQPILTTRFASPPSRWLAVLGPVCPRSPSSPLQQSVPCL